MLTIKYYCPYDIETSHVVIPGRCCCCCSRTLWCTTASMRRLTWRTSWDTWLTSPLALESANSPPSRPSTRVQSSCASAPSPSCGPNRSSTSPSSTCRCRTRRCQWWTRSESLDAIASCAVIACRGCAGMCELMAMAEVSDSLGY